MRLGRGLGAIVLAAAGALAATGEARALEGFDTQNWKPAFDPYGYITVEGARSLDFFQVHAAAYVSWAHNPLQFSIPPSGDVRRSLIKDLTMVDFVGSVGLIQFGNGGLEIGADLPYAIDIDGIDPQNFPDGEMRPGAFGDFRTSIKLTVLDREDDAIGLAAKFYQVWPTGNDEVFLSDNRTFKPGLSVILEKQLGIIRIGGEVGYEYIDGEIKFANVEIDDRLRFGVAAALEPFGEKLPLSLAVEAFGWGRADRLFHHEEETPIEIGAAVKYTGTLFAELGGGVGLNEGVGAPDGRIFAALGLTF